MTVSLAHILTLTGPLDDATGFDAPRERFRRFLLEYVHDPATARSLIDQCQYAPGLQSHRALQDLVALLGQLLGFRAEFGGVWRSRLDDHVITLTLAPSTSSELSQLLIDGDVEAQPDRRQLFVVTPQSIARTSIVEALVAKGVRSNISVVSLSALLTLADMSGDGRISHREVVRLIDSDLGIDFVVALVGTSNEARPADTNDGTFEPSFWLAPVVPDYETSPEAFLDVVSQRRAFGVAPPDPSGNSPHKGDWICFYIAGRGVVGHARISSFVGSANTPRDGRRLKQILILQDLELRMDEPIAPDAEAQLRLRAADVEAHPAQKLIAISRSSFETMTAVRVDATRPLQNRSLTA